MTATTLIAARKNFIWNGKPIYSIKLGATNGAQGRITFRHGIIGKGAANMNEAQNHAFQTAIAICQKAGIVATEQPQDLLQLLENGGWEIYPS